MEQDFSGSGLVLGLGWGTIDKAPLLTLLILVKKITLIYLRSDRFVIFCVAGLFSDFLIH